MTLWSSVGVPDLPRGSDHDAISVTVSLGAPPTPPEPEEPPNQANQTDDTDGSDTPADAITSTGAPLAAPLATTLV